MLDTSTSTTNIALSKRKLVYSLIGVLVLLAGSSLFILFPQLFDHYVLLNDPRWARAFGGLSIVFWGVLAFFIVKKMRDPAPGLVVTAEGMVDNAGGLVSGLIPWADVTGIRELELMGQKMVMVLLRDPEAYISRQTNPFKRQLMNTNYKSYGSPINISANTLECSYPELLALLTSRLAAFKIGKL